MAIVDGFHYWLLQNPDYADDSTSGLLTRLM
jgi:hypothetical protein